MRLSLSADHRSFEKQLGLRWKVGRIILDPSILFSERHTSSLLHWDRGLYLAPTLTRVLDSGDQRLVSDVLSAFARFPSEGLVSHGPLPKILKSTSFVELRRKCGVYQPSAEALDFARNFVPSLPDAGLSPETKNIVLEEVAFMRQHSSLIMRTKATIRTMKRYGALVLDASNRIFNDKHELLARIRGPRWMLAVLVGMQAIVTDNSILKYGSFLVMLIDP